MSDLWEEAVALVAGAFAARAGVARLFGWSRRRCDEALAAARHFPTSRPRLFAVMAEAAAGPLSRARARDLRALQQALDDEGRDGVLLARRAVPALPPPDGAS